MYDLVTYKQSKFFVRTDTVEKDIIEQGYGSTYIKYFSVEPGELWLDAGANIGSFSIYAATMGAFVLSFEPMPETFKVLQMNIVENGLCDRIVPINRALVSRKDSFVTIHEKKRNTGGCSMYDELGRDGDIVKVPTFNIEWLNLDDWCVKMDVEGAEIELIPRLGSIKKFACEYHTPFLEKGSFDRTLEFLGTKFSELRTEKEYGGVDFIWGWN